MSGTSDAMRIVMELIEETIGKIVLRDVKKFVEEKKTAMMYDKTNVDVAEDDKADWVDIIDSERNDMWWIDGGESDKANVANVKVNDDEVESDKVKAADAKKDDKINVDKEDNGESKVDEMKFPEYDRMNFNWKEVKVLYTGHWNDKG